MIKTRYLLLAMTVSVVEVVARKCANPSCLNVNPKFGKNGKMCLDCTNERAREYRRRKKEQIENKLDRYDRIERYMLKQDERMDSYLQLDSDFAKLQTVNLRLELENSNMRAEIAELKEKNGDMSKEITELKEKLEKFRFYKDKRDKKGTPLDVSPGEGSTDTPLPTQPPSGEGTKSPLPTRPPVGEGTKPPLSDDKAWPPLNRNKPAPPVVKKPPPVSRPPPALPYQVQSDDDDSEYEDED